MVETKLNGTIENKGKNKGWNNLKPCKKGETHNPNGRPLGQRNYDTIRREALIAIGKKNGKTPEEIENMLLEAGISNALRGDFRYYKDDLDRKYGQAIQKQEISGDLTLPFTIKIEKMSDGNKQLNEGTSNQDVPKTI